MTFGHTFSTEFDIEDSLLEKLGVFNPTLDVDARLFIHPFLIPYSKHKEFSECAYEKYEEHFTSIYKLIELSEAPNDKAWKGALTKFQFSEANGMSGTCLGYSKKSTHGHAFGPKKTAQSLGWAKDVIELGVKDPELFSSLPLFEDGIGPDLISDMFASITIDCILAFNNRILSEIEKNSGKIIKTESFELQGRKCFLPKNPFSTEQRPEPIILLADDILRHLPLFDDPRKIPKIIEKNGDLRQRVNTHIGEIFKTKSKKDKDHIKSQAMVSAAAFQTFLDLLKKLDSENYDIYKDVEGLLAWRDIASVTTAIHKFEIKLEESLSSEEKLNNVVLQIIGQFTRLVEKNRLNRVFYVGDSVRKEAFAQLLFYAIADSYCDAAGIGMTAEADAGVGPVDFKFNDGPESVLVEIKLSSNSATVSGYKNQLGAYMEAERASFGHYVVIDVGKMGKKWENLQKVVLDNPEYAKRHKVHLVDGTLKASASHRK